MTRLAIAEDHAIVRSGLKQMMALVGDLEVVAEAVNGSEVIALCDRDDLHVLLLDLNMPGLSGNDLIARVRAKRPKLPILILSMHNTAQIGMAAIKAGASGYVTKDSEPAILIEAIRKVAAGGRYIAPQMAQAIALYSSSEPSGRLHDSLSDREMSVFRELVAGRSVNEIADKFHISNKTVSTHKARMMEKLGANSTAELVRYAVDHGLLP
jgi:DNA-binding NarL/FixJ family response regulator